MDKNEARSTKRFGLGLGVVALLVAMLAALGGCSTRRFAALEGRVFSAEVALAAKANSAAVAAEFERVRGESAAAVARADTGLAAERRDRDTAVAALAGRLTGETAAREAAVAGLAGRADGLVAGVTAAVRAAMPTAAAPQPTPATARPVPPAPKPAVVTARPAAPAPTTGFVRWRAEQAVAAIRATHAKDATSWVLLPGFDPVSVDTKVAVGRNIKTASLLEAAVAAQTTEVLLVVGLTTPDEEKDCMGAPSPLCRNLGGARAAHAKAYFALPRATRVGSVVSEDFADRGRAVMFFFKKK